MIAAAAGITPHSPTPLTPSGLSGEGDTWLISSMRGSSVAVGSRYSAKLVRDRLRGLVVLHPLEQRIADAVHDAARDLALDDHRVDLPAAVAHDHIAQDPHRAGGRIDLDLHRVRGVAVGEAAGHEVGGLLQPRLSRLQPLGQRVAGDAGRLARNVAEPDRHVAASTRTSPSSSSSCFDRRPEQPGCDPQCRLAHALCGNVHGVAGVDGLPAGEPAVTHRHVGGIAGDHLDVRRRDVELVGGDLGQHGGGALAHRGGAGRHRDTARPADAHDAGLERPAPRALGPVGDPDADMAPLRQRGGLAGGKAVVVDRLEHHRLALGKSPLSYFTGVPARVFIGVV